LLAEWSNLDEFVQRKIIAWHHRKRFTSWRDFENKLDEIKTEFVTKTLRDADFVLEPLFDPFLAYMTISGNGHLELVDASVGEDGRRLPSISAATGPSNVSFVRHRSVQHAESDATKYAQYVVRALTSTISASNDDNEVSIVQDWADWDNVISVKCILYTLPGAVTLYSVGRPVESKGCGMLDFDAEWDGSRPLGRAPSWPPCLHVDRELSTNEAINVAATWVAVLTMWQRAGAPERAISVVNAGFPIRHGMNPAMHSPIVDIWPVTDADNEDDEDGAKKHELVDTLRKIDANRKLSGPVRVS
jgi:hypothetical protein